MRRLLIWWNRRKIDKLCERIALTSVFDENSEMKQCREQAFTWARKWMRLHDSL